MKKEIKNKELIKEFKDPYQKNSTNFPVATVMNGPSLGPGPAKIELKFDPKAPLRPASNIEITQALNLDPQNVSCINDLAENWMYYGAFGAFVAASTYPIVRPALGAMGKIGAGAARGVGSPFKTAQAAASFLKKTQEAGFKKTISAAGKLLKEFMFKPGRAKSFASWLFAGKDAALAWTNTSNAWSALKGGSFAKSVMPASKAGLRSTWAGVKMTKNIFLVALVTTIVYKGFGLEKLFKSGIDSEDRAISAGSAYIDLFLNFFIQYDMALEAIMLKMNTNLSEDCALTNVIASTVLCTFLLPSGLVGGNKLTLSYKLENVKNIKNGDDLRLFVQQERALIIEKFNTSVLDDFIKIFKESGRSAKDARKFFENFLKNPKYVGADAAAAAQCGAAYTRREAELIKMISKQNEGIQEVLRGAEETSAQTQAAVREIIMAAKQQAKNMKKDFRASSTARRNSGAAEDLVKYEASVDSLLEIQKSITEIEALLTAGSISVLEAAKMYNRLFQKPLRAFSKELKAAAKLEKGTRSSVEDLIITLNNLQKDQAMLKKALVAAGPAGAPNFLEKIFQTRRARKAKDVEKLANAETMAASTMDAIRTMGTKLNPDELIRLEKAVEGAQTALRAASGAGVKNTKLLAAERALVVGFFGGITAAIAKQFLDVDDINDLETWTKQNLAKSLAWDGFFSWALIDIVRGAPTAVVNLMPGFKIKNPKIEETYQDALLQILNKVITNREIAAGIYDRYIFAGNGAFLENNFSGIKKPEDLSDDVVEKIVNDFRLKKSNFEKIEASLQSDFGANLSNLGLSGINNNDNAVEFRKIWWPVIMNVLVANSGIVQRIRSIKNEKLEFFQMDKNEKIAFLNSDVFIFKNPDDVNDHLEDFVDMFEDQLKAKRESKKLKENQVKEEKQKQNNLISELVQEVIQEYGKGYTPYPYHSHIGEEDEPAEDFIQDWKDFELSLVRDQTRETAISVAKILVKDLELFGDVMDLVGKNQSVAVEILQKLRKDEENS
jgi:hypothetical protein